MIEVDVILRTRCRSQVVHNRGHGFSKRFTLQGCTNCPLQTSHIRPVSTWLGKRLKLRNVRVPLTNNAHSGWPPVSRRPTRKLATLSNRSLPSVAGLGGRLVPLLDRALSRTRWASQGTMPSWPWLGLETTGDPTSTHTRQK